VPVVACVFLDHVHVDVSQRAWSAAIVESLVQLNVSDGGLDVADGLAVGIEDILSARAVEVLDVAFLIIVAVVQRRHLLQGLSANTPEEPAALNISQAAATPWRLRSRNPDKLAAKVTQTARVWGCLVASL
jgi:hypothetical protein